MSIIRFKEANCKNCYKCLRNCQVKSIAFKNEQAEILENECILCGHCFLVCPQNAKYIDSDLGKVKGFIKRGEQVYVSIAPSYASYFDGVPFGKLAGAMRRLGVRQAEETAIGAARVSREYSRLMQEGIMKNIITTACPTAVLLVEKYYPDLIPYLTPCVSPMVAHAKMMRDAYGQDIKIVFIGPCISKKHEAAADLALRSGVNAVLLFEDLEQWLVEESIDFSAVEDSGPEPIEIQGRTYPLPGGILQTTGGNESAYTRIFVDGVDRCRETLDSLRSHDISGYFIEMSACPGSCLGGPGIVSRKAASLSGQNLVRESAKRRLATSVAPLSENTEADLERFFLNRSQTETLPTEKEIDGILQKMGKALPEKQLNCGSCGYPSCRDKAIAVCHGKADIWMCLPHMREKAESISNVVIDHTPNGIFLLDGEFRIVEYNSSAQRIFGIKTDLYGKPLSGLFDCRALKKVKDTGGVIGDGEYYPEMGLYLEQTAVYIEEHSMYLLIVKDITNEMQRQTQLTVMQKETVEIAQKVIDKQMRVAQEIASLLGETTAETKLALTRLKKSIVFGTHGDGQ